VTKYAEIWMEIKRTGSAEVTVSKDAARRILNGVKKIKTAENTARRYAGLVGWSKLVITSVPLSDTRLRVKMELLYLTKL